VHVDTGLSSRFSTSHNAYRVGLLITIAGDPAPEIGVEPPDQESDSFAPAARNVTVELRQTHPAVTAVMVYQRFPMESTESNEYVIRVGDLSCTNPQPLGISLFVSELDQLGSVHVADVQVSADVVVGDGMAHRTITVPIEATLDGTDHIEPTVERAIVRFQAARAREDAIRQADAGNFDGAANTLRVARDSLATYARQAEIAEEMADLAAESMRLARREHPEPPP
jgi:hypothetical protein